MTQLVFISVCCYFILQIRLEYRNLVLEKCYKQRAQQLVLYRLVHNQYWAPTAIISHFSLK